MTNEARIFYLNRAVLGYMAGGLCVLYGGINYWFLRPTFMTTRC